MEVDDPAQPPRTVVQVVEQGYMIHDRLLRPARVVVSKRRARTKPEIGDGGRGAEWGSPLPMATTTRKARSREVK